MCTYISAVLSYIHHFRHVQTLFRVSSAFLSAVHPHRHQVAWLGFWKFILLKSSLVGCQSFPMLQWSIKVLLSADLWRCNNTPEHVVNKCAVNHFPSQTHLQEKSRPCVYYMTKMLQRCESFLCASLAMSSVCLSRSFSASSSVEVPAACGLPLSSLWWVPRWWWLRRGTLFQGTTCSIFGHLPSMTCGASGPKSFMENSVLEPLTTSVSIGCYGSETSYRLLLFKYLFSKLSKPCHCPSVTVLYSTPNCTAEWFTH